MARPYKIELVEIATGAVERTFEYQSEHLMLKAERGLLRQIDTERYFTRFVPPDRVSAQEE